MYIHILGQPSSRCRPTRASDNVFPALRAHLHRASSRTPSHCLNGYLIVLLLLADPVEKPSPSHDTDTHSDVDVRRPSLDGTAACVVFRRHQFHNPCTSMNPLHSPKKRLQCGSSFGAGLFCNLRPPTKTDAKDGELWQESSYKRGCPLIQKHSFYVRMGIRLRIINSIFLVRHTMLQTPSTTCPHLCLH